MRRELPKRIAIRAGDLVILYITVVNCQFISACWMCPFRVCMAQVLMKNDDQKNSLMNKSQQLNRSLGLALVVVVVVGNIIGSGCLQKGGPDGRRTTFLGLGINLLGTRRYYQFIWSVE
jgi:hypothetical protein